MKIYNNLKLLGGQCCFAILLGLCLLLNACGESAPETPHALPYIVIKTDDFSFPGRKRMNVAFYVEKKESTFLERVHTAMKAAYDLQQQYGCAVAVSWMATGPNSQAVLGETLLAKAIFMPDGKGLSGKNPGKKWDVLGTEVTPTDDQEQLREAIDIMYKNVGSTGASHACTDLPASACYKVMAEKLGLPAETRPAWLTPVPYPVD